MRTETNGSMWFTIKEAAEHSEVYLQRERQIVGKGYSTWSLRAMCVSALKFPEKALFKVRKEVGIMWEIEKASFEHFLLTKATPHAPHSTYTRIVGNKRIKIRSSKQAR